MKKIFVMPGLTVLMLALSGCGIRTAKGMLDSAEAIMNERPDSALMLLEDLDSAEVRGREMKARYSLLMSMALDKNVIDTADISVILPALRYYGHRGDVLNRARTYFYYGRVLQNGGDNEAALEAVSKAELYAGQTDDLYLQGLIADCKGQLHEAQDEFESAAECYEKAMTCFKDIGHIRNEMYMTDRLSVLYAKVDDGAETMAYAIKAKGLAESIKDTTEIISMTINVALAYNISGDYSRALEVLAEACDEYLEGEIPPSYYMILSEVYFSLHDIQEARYYSKKAMEHSERTDSGYLGACVLLSEIEYASGNYKQGYDYLDRALNLMAEQNQLQYEESIYEADMRYKNKELMELVLDKERRIEGISTIWMLSILAVSGVSLSIVQTWRRRVLKKTAEIDEYRNKISTMQEYGAVLKKIKDSVLEKNTLIDKQIATLADMMDILVHSSESLKLAEQMRFNKLVDQEKAEASEMLKIFRAAFESRYPGVQERLRLEFGLPEREIDLYVLIIFECSASVIAYIFRTTEGYVYNRRAQLRKKIRLTDEHMTFANHLKKMING